MVRRSRRIASRLGIESESESEFESEVESEVDDDIQGEPNHQEYAFNMTQNQKNKVRNKINPYTDEDETLNCESIHKFIKACASLKQPLYVKFWSKKSNTIKKYKGIPYYTNPSFPLGHPGGQPSFLFVYNNVDHLVLWAKEEGSDVNKWIRCRKHTYGQTTYHPRITADDFSTKPLNVEDCIQDQAGPAVQNTVANQPRRSARLQTGVQPLIKQVQQYKAR